jgi:outer membrane protein insertion porin family
VGTDFASSLIGSDDEYLRVVGDALRCTAAARRRWVLSGRGAGTFLDALSRPDGGYIPPERRFYGGGPTGVRGFRFNELGPTVYVARPRRTGDDGFEVDHPHRLLADRRHPFGARLSAEVSGPAPVFSQQLRVAAFVDAGQVWAPRDTLAVQPPIRVTPGVGVRVATPVGPLRFDVGYNPYRLEPGPLYGIDEMGRLLPEPLDPRYEPPDERGFFRRLVFQVSVGQPL